MVPSPRATHATRRIGAPRSSWSLVSFGLTVLLAALFGGSSRGFFPIGTPILLYLAVCVAHLVVIIVGLSRAGKGQVFENPIAIPFIRR